MYIKVLYRCVFVNCLKREEKTKNKKKKTERFQDPEAFLASPLLSFPRAATSGISSRGPFRGGTSKQSEHKWDGFSLPGRLPHWGHSPVLGSHCSHRSTWARATKPRKFPPCQARAGQRSKRWGPSGLPPARDRIPCAKPPDARPHTFQGKTHPPVRVFTG